MKILYHTKKIFLAFLLSLVFFIPSVILSSCGNKEVKINGIEIENPSISIKYRESFPDDPFKVKFRYSDGSIKTTSELTEEEINSITVTVTKDNKEWDMSKTMTVGFYTVTYKVGNYSTSATISVEKANYTSAKPIVTLNNNSIMVYEGNLLEPRVSFSEDEVTQIVYYYQNATNDNSYNEDKQMGEYYSYTYKEDELCSILPGNYQMYAIISTYNYNDIRTPLKNFVVQKNNKSNYALFKSVNIYNETTHLYDSTYVPFERSDAYEFTYYYEGCEKLSDYAKHLNDLYVFEVDDEGNIKRNENGDMINGSPIPFLLGAEYERITMVSSDSTVTSLGDKYITFKYTPNSYTYNEINFVVKIKINKMKVRVNSQLDIYVDENSTIQGRIEYDGQEHHLKMDVIEENGVYYGYYAFMKNNVYQKTKIYTISNYSRTNVGTYNVVLNVVNDLRNLVELEWTTFDNATYEYVTHTGTSANIGKWMIIPKEYDVQCEILVNGKPYTDYCYQSAFTLLKGKTYTFNVNNIVGLYHNEPDDSVNVTFDCMRLKYYDNQNDEYIDVPSNYVQIDNVNGTLTLSNNCPYESCHFFVEFNINNVNYIVEPLQSYVNVYRYYTFDEVYVKLQNKGSDNFEFVYNPYEYETSDATKFYVSNDGTNYSRWEDIYSTLYYEDNGNKVINTSNVPNYQTEYYILDGSEYVRTYVYYSYIRNSPSDIEFSTTNTINYDGKEKELRDATIALINVDNSSWNNIYDKVYIIERDFDNNESYVLNTSNIFDFNKEYYKKIGDDYVLLCNYYKVGNGFIYVTSKIESIDEYYLGLNYFYLNVNLDSLEKYDETTSSWVKVDKAIEVGKYRNVLSFITNENAVLIDNEGNYSNTLYYEWYIEDNLERIKLTNYNLAFKNDNGDDVEVNNYVVNIESSNTPLKVILTPTFDKDIDYSMVYLSTCVAEYGPGTSYGYIAANLYEANTYRIRVYFAFNGDYVLLDENDTVIEYVEIIVTMNVN